MSLTPPLCIAFRQADTESRGQPEHRYMQRLHDPTLLNHAVDMRVHGLNAGFNAAKWLDDLSNIALLKGGDIALFEGSEGVYEIHWLMGSHGKDAIEVASDFITEIFQKFNALRLWGRTPKHCRAARMFNRLLTRKIGGGSKGWVDTEYGPQEIFMLDRGEWKGN